MVIQWACNWINSYKIETVNIYKTSQKGKPVLLREVQDAATLIIRLSISLLTSFQIPWIKIKGLLIGHWNHPLSKFRNRISKRNTFKLSINTILIRMTNVNSILKINRWYCLHSKIKRVTFKRWKHKVTVIDIKIIL